MISGERQAFLIDEALDRAAHLPQREALVAKRRHGGIGVDLRDQFAARDAGSRCPMR